MGPQVSQKYTLVLLLSAHCPIGYYTNERKCNKEENRMQYRCDYTRNSQQGQAASGAPSRLAPRLLDRSGTISRQGCEPDLDSLPMSRI